MLAKSLCSFRLILEAFYDYVKIRSNLEYGIGN